MRTTLLSAAVLFAAATVGIVRADKILEAGPGQNLVSVFQIYSTSTAQPAMLAKGGGTILSINDLVTILPPQWSNWYRGRKLGLRPQYGKITKATKTEVMTVQDLEGEDYTHALPDLLYNSDEPVLKNV